MPDADPAARAVALDLVDELTEPFDSDLATSYLAAATFLVSAEHAGIADTGALAEQYLDRGIRLMVERQLGHSLARGWTGVGWMIEQLVDEGLADELCAPLDQTLADDLAVERWTGNYDLLRGLAGLGVYALARRRSAGTALADAIVGHLEALAEHTEQGERWFTRAELLFDEDRAAFPHGRYDHGLSHGIAGVVGVLARFIAAAVQPARCRRLLDGAVAYLLASAPPRPHPRFPTYVVGDERHETRTLAWCNGDLGIALALFAAGRVAQRPDWVHEALTTALAAAALRDDRNTDAGLCHGTMGLAHAFHRLHRATELDAFTDAAVFWRQRTLARRRPGDRLAGYAHVRIVGGVATSTIDASILTGSTGIALALLAAEDANAQPSWDALMMFDLPA